MNMFKGLLFLHGHFTRPEDLDETPVAGRAEYGARTAADDFARPLGNRAASAAWFGRDTGKSRQGSTQSVSDTPGIQPAVTARSSSQPRPGLLSRLQYLGGRPMHAGHNFDLEDPFEALVREAGSVGRSPHHAEAGARDVACNQTCMG